MTLCIVINTVVCVVFMAIVGALVWVILQDRKAQQDYRDAKELAEKNYRDLRDKQFQDEMQRSQAECHDFHSECVDKMVAAFKVMGESLDLNTEAMGKRETPKASNKSDGPPLYGAVT